MMTTCMVNQSMENEKKALSLSLRTNSWPLLFLVTSIGGFSASYSFLARGGVFAFAQTGNIIYSGQVMASGHFGQVVTFLCPVLSYMLGLFSSQQLEKHLEGKVSFQKTVLLLESLLMALTALLPVSYLATRLALCLLGFSSGLQMETFHRVGTYEYTSIMVMGNMKRTVEAIGDYLNDHRTASLHKALVYVVVNAIFCFGSAWGYTVTRTVGDTAILLPALLMALGAYLLKD
jgi:uncharacterized membrane protein YoaK (UPF0700 family)